MTTATLTSITRTAVMNLAWELVKRHMRQNRYTVYVMARAMRDAWSEHQQRSEGIRPVCDLTPLERELVAARADANSDPWNEAKLARAVDEESIEMAEKRELIEAAKGQICAVTFVKKDGTIRTMKVQPAKLKFHVKGDRASEQAQRAVAKVNSLIDCARFAYENDTCGIPMDQRGLCMILQIASEHTAELLEAVESLEIALAQQEQT